MLTDQNAFVGRGAPGRAYDAVFDYPSINGSGDVAFTALSGGQRLLFRAAAGGSPVQLAVIKAPAERGS